MTTVKVKYENGVFRPLENVSLKDGKVATVVIDEKETAKISDFSGIWKEDDEIENIMQDILALRKNFRAGKVDL